MSWIALEDMISIINFVLENENVRGPINATAPNPVTNHTFTKTLGEVINRPTFIPVPEFGVKFMFGEMGETLLLGGSRVVPKKLQDLGFTFKYPELKEALKKATE
jgi:NAD dependent epimerase/dehydratase family enzyme